MHTALRKGKREGIPRAEATTAKALAVVFLTYSSMLSISGRIVEIIVAKPAAYNAKGQIKNRLNVMLHIFLKTNTNAIGLKIL